MFFFVICIFVRVCSQKNSYLMFCWRFRWWINIDWKNNIGMHSRHVCSGFLEEPFNDGSYHTKPKKKTEWNQLWKIETEHGFLMKLIRRHHGRGITRSHCMRMTISKTALEGDTFFFIWEVPCMRMTIGAIPSHAAPTTFRQGFINYPR